MKNLIVALSLALSFMNTAMADSSLEYQKSVLENDKQVYIENKCVINSVQLWFVHTCKDVAYEAGKILDAKGYRFAPSRVNITFGGPMKSELVNAKITSAENPSLSADLAPQELVGKVVAQNAMDKSGSKHLVLSLVSPSLDLVAVSSTRIGKQGVTNDYFCQNSYIMARKYLADLKKLPSCKAVTGQNDL